MDGAADDFVSDGVGKRQMAEELRLGDPGGAEGEGRWRIVAGLSLQAGIVDGAGVEAGAGAGFEAADGEAELGKAVGEAHRGEVTGAARVVILEADMDEAFEKGAGGEDDG